VIVVKLKGGRAVTLFSNNCSVLDSITDFREKYGDDYCGVYDFYRFELHEGSLFDYVSNYSYDEIFLMWKSPDNYALHADGCYGYKFKENKFENDPWNKYLATLGMLLTWNSGRIGVPDWLLSHIKVLGIEPGNISVEDLRLIVQRKFAVDLIMSGLNALYTYSLQKKGNKIFGVSISSKKSKIDKEIARIKSMSDAWNLSQQDRDNIDNICRYISKVSSERRK